MSPVAQNLCEGIQTSDKPSFEDVCRASKRSLPQDKVHGKTSKPDVGSRSRKSIVIERHKTINNVPKDRAIEKQLRSKEIITKKYQSLRDIAVNTVKTGNAKRDTDCVTIIRARDRDHKQCICKSSKLRRKADDDKHTQTNVPHYANKSCCGCIEMTTCGTQYVDAFKPIILPSQDDDLISLTRVLKETKMDNQGSNNYNLPNNPKLMVNKNDLRQIFNNANFPQKEYYGKQIPPYSLEMTNAVLEKKSKSCRKCSQCSSARNGTGNRFETNESHRHNQSYESKEKEIHKYQNYMGARNWALSKYLTRGPDF